MIGVAEPGFRGLRAGFRPAVVVPMMMQGQLEPAWQALERRGTSWLKIIGRLKSPAARQAVEARARTRLPESRQRGPRWRVAARQCSSRVARRTRETGSGRPRVLSAGFQVRPSSDRGARHDRHLVGRGRAELPLSVCRPFHRSAQRTRAALGARSNIVQARAGSLR